MFFSLFSWWVEKMVWFCCGFMILLIMRWVMFFFGWGFVEMDELFLIIIIGFKFYFWVYWDKEK